MNFRGPRFADSGVRRVRDSRHSRGYAADRVRGRASHAGSRLTSAIPTDGDRHHTFLFAIDDDIVVDAAVNGNDARFINHSCDPNCDVVVEDKRLWIETIRDVEPGEELAYDYAFVLRGATHAGGEATLSVFLRCRELSRDDPGEEALTFGLRWWDNPTALKKDRWDLRDLRDRPRQPDCARSRQSLKSQRSVSKKQSNSGRATKLRRATAHQGEPPPPLLVATRCSRGPCPPSVRPDPARPSSIFLPGGTIETVVAARVRAPHFGRIVVCLRRAIAEREADVDRQHAARVVADSDRPTRCRRAATTVSMPDVEVRVLDEPFAQEPVEPLARGIFHRLEEVGRRRMLERPAARVFAERVVERLGSEDLVAQLCETDARSSRTRSRRGAAGRCDPARPRAARRHRARMYCSTCSRS